jgi:hypothetical protein
LAKIEKFSGLKQTGLMKRFGIPTDMFTMIPVVVEKG